jgi:transposase
VKRDQKTGRKPSAAEMAIGIAIERLNGSRLTPEEALRIIDPLQIAAMACEEMRQRIEELVRGRFGRSSEKKSKEELAAMLAEGGPGIPDDVADAYQDPASQPNAKERDHKAREPRNPRKPGGRNSSIPASIPRVEVVVDISDGQKVCSCCSSEKEKIGADTTEQLNYVPSQLEIVRTIYPKYACSRCRDDKVIMAPRKTRPTIGDGLATFGLLSHIVVSKYSQSHLI